MEKEVRTVKVLLNTVERVKNFSNKIFKFENTMDICSGRYIIDAKSVMGLFSIDLSKKLELKIYDDGDDIDKIIECLDEFLV